jgi:hypothetical protein
MSAFQGIISFLALPGTEMQYAAVLHQPDPNYWNIKSCSDLENFINNSSPLPVNPVWMRMGDSFEDDFGHPYLLCYYTAQHPHPEMVAELNTIYFRRIRTQGALWLTMADHNRCPVLFDKPGMIIDISYWFNSKQEFWRQKFHSGDVAIPKVPEDSIHIDFEMDLNQFIARMRNAT